MAAIIAQMQHAGDNKNTIPNYNYLSAENLDRLNWLLGSGAGCRLFNKIYFK